MTGYLSTKKNQHTHFSTKKNQQIKKKSSTNNNNKTVYQQKKNQQTHFFNKNIFQQKHVSTKKSTKQKSTKKQQKKCSTKKMSAFFDFVPFCLFEVLLPIAKTHRLTNKHRIQKLSVTIVSVQSTACAKRITQRIA